MSSKSRLSGQQSANSGATRQRKNSGKSSGTDKSKQTDEADDFPLHARPTFVSQLTIPPKVSYNMHWCIIYYVVRVCNK